MNLIDDNQKIKAKPEHLSSFKELRIHKYDPERFFYLASYSYDTFINNESLRNLLYNINNNHINQQKSSMNFLKLKPKTKNMQKYFMFPQEIIYAHLKNYGLKIVEGNQVSLSKDTGCYLSFVKLYLMDKDIISPLENQLGSFKLHKVETKCSGLDVMTPVKKKQNQN